MQKSKKKKFCKLRIVCHALIFGILLFLPGIKVNALTVQDTERNEEKNEEREGEAADYRYYEQEWGMDVSLRGLFSRKSMYFQIGNWKSETATLQLKMNASSLIDREIAYLTISLNGIAIETIPVPENGKEIAIVGVDLPPEELLYESMNSITIDAYLRGQRTDACVDDSSVSTWLNIFKESKVIVTYESLLQCENIADFYKKFLSIEALSYEESMIATGSKATQGAMTAMAQIVSGFAQSTVGDYQQVKSGVIQTPSELQKNPYVMYVDIFDNLPKYLQAAMSAPQRTSAGNQGIICLVNYENTKVLIVTGNDDVALGKAGELLSNKDLIPMLTETQALISEKKTYTMEELDREEYIELAPFGTEIKGNFKQSATFSIDHPDNRKLAESAELSLDFRHSKNLDYKKSLLSVYVNGIPIGSSALTEETAEGTTIKIPIPADLEVVGSFTIETVFNFYPIDDWCELTPEEVPWGYIAETSIIKWTTVENTEVFFEHYPFPFIKNGSFANLKILLPEKWSEQDMQTMLSILITMGSWKKTNVGKIEVLYGLQEDKLIDANIIAIADMSTNLFKNNIPIMEKDSGGAQLLLSPYSENLMAIMTITGGNKKGMLKTLNWLGNLEKIWELKGDVVFTDGEIVSSKYTRSKQQTFTLPKPEKTIDTEENMTVVIVGSVLILILLSLAMLLIKYGRNKKDEE